MAIMEGGKAMTTVHESVSVEEFEELADRMPAAFTAELVNGRVIVVPAPVGDHNEDVQSVADQIYAAKPELRLYQEPGLEIGSYRTGRARPDGAVARRGHFRGQPSWADPSGILLVLEVTSGRHADAEVDRVEKRDAYAATGIPVYLLIDRHRRQVTAHWAPSDGRYTHESSTVFGEKLPLPEPFGFDLDTTELA
jgi:Uma2 family endonuclease